MRATPLETYKAVTVTSMAAKDVVQEMVTDSVDRAKHAVEEARAVAERRRAKAELMEDRPCPDVRPARHHPTLCLYHSMPLCLEDSLSALACHFCRACLLYSCLT